MAGGPAIAAVLISCSGLGQRMLSSVALQAVTELGDLTATSDREQASNEAEWDTLTRLIEADRRQQVCQLACTLIWYKCSVQAL